MTEEKYYVGQSDSFTKTVTEADVVLFAGVTGDLNPAHVNDVYAKNSMFKGRIAHGMFSAGLISAVFGTKLPGPGTIYLSQTLQFRKPVYFNDTITATVTIKEIDEKGRILFDTTVTNQNGDTVVTGEAKMLPPKD
ncbi:MaoC family dehydratase [Eremococcus coleocola]|uniref:MaoC-like protein n=1 Tax=Eremococcus coleocola ACS-139-V-Col8 TaxID=908337 RepID=E4KRA9_9LACT|nr:MaoC family dehydratase [Eremococcus coleocola]EFR30497.1 MaoC-like protein [Eremococcus coleocola ACS-139-V-Col8]